MNARWILAGILCLSLLAACDTFAPAPTLDEAAVRTEAAQTVAAEMTAAAPPSTQAAPPTSIPTISPPPPSPTPTLTPTTAPATETTPLFPTAAEPTATLVFPTAGGPTATIVFPTAAPPTPPPGDPALTLGVPTFSDSFNNKSNWTLFDDECFESEIEDGHYKMTGKQPKVCWEVTWPKPKNFYLQALAQSTSSCPQDGSYGLFFRAPDASSGYVFGLTCQGKFFFWSWDNEKESGGYILSPASNPVILVGANQVNRLGVLAQVDTYKFYVNGFKVAEAQDEAFIKDGLFGFSVRGADEDKTIAYFDDLKMWELP